MVVVVVVLLLHLPATIPPPPPPLLLLLLHFTTTTYIEGVLQALLYQVIRQVILPNTIFGPFQIMATPLSNYCGGGGWDVRRKGWWWC